MNPGAPTGSSGFWFTNASAGTEGTASCDTTPSVNDVWFAYYATASGVVLVRTCSPVGFAAGSGGMTVSVLSAACGGTELACRNYMYGAACTPTAPSSSYQIAFVATAGVSYFIRVATTVGTGIANFHLTVVPPGPPPPNDNCAGALPVTTGTNGPYHNVDATQDATASCTAAQPSIIRDVWFSYTATATGTTTFAVQLLQAPGTPTIPPQIAVFTGCGGTELACSWGQGSAVAVSVTTGTTYLIRVDSYPHLWGQTLSAFSLVVTQLGPPPPNDECTGAIPLVLGAPNGPFSHPTATQSAGGYTGYVDVWYSFTTGACPGAYTVEVCGTPIFGFSFHAACGAPLIGYGGLDPYFLGCIGATGTILGGAFTTYLLRVLSVPGWVGSYPLLIKTPTAGAQTFIGFSSPFGPGSIQANLGGLPPGGLYFFPVSLAATTTTSPSFYGINMTTAQLLTQFNIGLPFAGSVDACGNAQIGPFSGIPTGTTVYAVGLGFAAGYVLPPTTVTSAMTYTVP